MPTKFQHLTLCQDAYAPTSRFLIFLRATATDVEAAVVEWSKKWNLGADGELGTSRVDGGLPAVLQSLLPLTAVGELQLIVPTTSGWTAYFGNHLGGNGFGPGRILSELLGCEAVFLRVSERLSKKAVAAGYMPSHGCLDFTYWKSGERLRYVGLVYDTKWVFQTTGEPLPFEDVAAYENPRVSERVTFEQICAAAEWFGLRPFDTDFYCPPGQTCALFERPNVNKRGSYFGWNGERWSTPEGP